MLVVSTLEYLKDVCEKNNVFVVHKLAKLTKVTAGSKYGGDGGNVSQ